MKVFKNLRDVLKSAPAEVSKEVTAICHNVVEDDPDNPDNDLYQVEFMNDLGGYIHVVEEFEDLKKIDTLVTHDNEAGESERWKNITETASIFDAAEYLPDNSFVMLLLCTNNAGGHTYYIPKEIVDQCSYIEESIRLTNNGELKHYSVADYVNNQN